MRSATLERSTRETRVQVNLNLDGKGRADVDTGCGFLDHMLMLMTVHGGLDLTIRCSGDRQVDDHHLTEDTGLVIQQASTPPQLINLIDKNQTDFDFILIDGAPHVNLMVRAMLLISNLVIVPLAPSSVEIWSFNAFEELIHRAEKLNSQLQTKICWNRVRRRVKSSEEHIQQVGKDSKLTAFKNQLTFRVAYMDSFSQGCSVYEWTDPVARAEIWSLCSAIKRLAQKFEPMNLPKSAAAQDFIKKG